MSFFLRVCFGPVEALHKPLQALLSRVFVVYAKVRFCELGVLCRFSEYALIFHINTAIFYQSYLYYIKIKQPVVLTVHELFCSVWGVLGGWIQKKIQKWTYM